MSGAASHNSVSDGIEYATAFLLDIKRQCPEVLKVADIDAFILNELNPLLVTARGLERHVAGMQRIVERTVAQHEQLAQLINSPEIEDFDKGVPLECAHQVERWGDAHDRSKSAENWYWLIGYLAGKALRSTITGDRAKALHHTISAAAALRNWHAAIKRDTSGTGVGEDPDLVLLDAGVKPEASGP